MPRLFLVPLGRRGEAIAEMERALQLIPFRWQLTRIYYPYLEREPDQAIAQLEKTLEMYKSFPAPHLYLARAYLQKKMVTEAMQEFQTAVTLSSGHPFTAHGSDMATPSQEIAREADRILGELARPTGRYVSSYDLAAICAGLGRKQDAVKWLQKAYDERASHFHHGS